MKIQSLGHQMTYSVAEQPSTSGKDSFKSLLAASMCASFSHSVVSNIALLDDESRGDFE